MRHQNAPTISIFHLHKNRESYIATPNIFLISYSLPHYYPLILPMPSNPNAFPKHLG